MCKSALVSGIVLASLLVGAAEPAAALVVPFHGTMSVKVGSVGPIAIEGSGSAEVTLAPDGSLSALALPAHAFHTTGLSAPVPTSSAAELFPLVAVGLTLDQGAASFAPGTRGFGGVMPLSGVGKLCLFDTCGGPNVVPVSIPAAVVGQQRSTVTVGGPVNLTVQGAPWTTGTAAGSIPWVRGGISESSGGGIDGLQMVTPIFIQTSLPALEIVYGSYVRIALQLELCNDGIDNDDDGHTDYPDDPQCSGPTDSTEGPAGACENGVDDDGDGQIDLADRGCLGPLDSTETIGTVCDNGLDDDGDGLVDQADPACDLSDPSLVWIIWSERGSGYACDDGYDNDHDGKTDYPDDPSCVSPFGTSENPAACGNGLDDDGDGKIDYPSDSGCVDLYDTSELVDVCSNGLDDDGDGLIDTGDPGCFGASDSNERGPVGYLACDDEIDNDGDAKSDFPADPGCFAAYDGDEADTVCGNDLDDDGDGLTDYPADPGCSGPNDIDEHGSQACDNGVDDDGDGLVDYPADPGCTSPSDASEHAAPGLPCDNGLDDDGDGFTDYPADPECLSPTSETESNPNCSDGIDNDGDGLADYPADPGCDGSDDRSEHTPTLLCDNGLDDDGDEASDQHDPGCSGPMDASERGENACDNGIDDDGDGLVDYPVDPGCVVIADSSENTAAVACDNGIDDDGDGLADFPTDPGCIGPADPDERDAATACDDAVDNDGDQLVDFPADPDCSSAADGVEGADGPACSNGVDDDGDGAIDALDLSCSGPDDLDEEVVFDDGAAHIVDAGATLAAESVRVSDGVGATSLDVSPGGAVGFRAVATGGSSLALTGGSINGDLVLRDAATADVTSGTLGGVLRTEGSAHAIVQGGTLGPALEARGTSRIELRVSGAGMRGLLAGFAGTAAGHLEDGTPFAIAFQRAPGATIELVPEPASALAELVSMLALARIWRRRSRDSRR